MDLAAPPGDLFELNMESSVISDTSAVKYHQYLCNSSWACSCISQTVHRLADSFL